MTDRFHTAQAMWREPRSQRVMAFCLLSLLSLMQYAPSITGDFIWDGRETFLQDPSIRDDGYFSSYFTQGVASHLQQQGTAYGSLSYYRPLIRVLHFLEYQVFGQAPAGYHAVSIGLNLLVVWLGFLVVRQIVGDARVALVSALLFAVNPSHVEAVSWAYSDSYLLFSCFALLSFYWYLQGKIIGSLLMFAAALLAQESAVLLPIVLLLERYLLAEKRAFRDYWFLWPYFLLLVLFLVARSLAVGGLPITHFGFVAWLNAVTTILVTSVKIFFLPDAAVALYHNKPGMFAEVSGRQYVVYLGVVALSLFALWLWRRHRAWLFWYLWFFVWLLVMFNVGEFAQFYFMDKILYLGSLGFCVLLAKGMLSVTVSKKVSVAVIAACLLAFFSVSLWRESFFLDEKRYFEQAVLFAPDFALLRYSMGMMYLEREEYVDAEKAFRETIRLDPRHSYAYNNLGNILYLRGDSSGALDVWRRAIVADPSNPQPYFNIAAGFDRLGDVGQALAYYRQYRDRQPNPSAAVLRRIQYLQGRRR